MLRSLHVRNYILIDSLDIDFPGGLVIVTGQTGAGKSIMLGALSLVGGAKADASMIASGADSCVVEAEFDYPGIQEIDRILEENDIESNGGHLIIRRTVAASGRSRSFVNDSPVQVQVLQDLSAQLIDIHSQHRSLLLTDHSFQLSVLDRYASNSGLLADCSASYRRLSSLSSELAELKSRLQRLSLEKDYNSAQFEQLDSAHLQDGELSSLEEEQKQLAHAEQIKEALGYVEQLFDPQDSPGPSVAAKDAMRSLERVRDYIPAASSLIERLDSVRIELNDIASEIADINSGINLSQERLEQVEQRMSQLYSLLHKHACRTEAELIAVRDSFAEALYDSSSIEEKIQSLESEISSEKKVYDGICQKLHDAREKAAPAFASDIRDALHFLELDRAEFKVEISNGNDSQSGRDAVAFLFSSTGTRLQDISKCASGGELSRIMLCLKEMMARFVGMPTLIFDEIDTGVSGSVADRMGQMICRMGADMQVFSITHLPQVAAKGKAHYVVEKSLVDGRTVSTIRHLEGRDRVLELARLLSGENITDAAVANAESLLDADA